MAAEGLLLRIRGDTTDVEAKLRQVGGELQRVEQRADQTGARSAAALRGFGAAATLAASQVAFLGGTNSQAFNAIQRVNLSASLMSEQLSKVGGAAGAAAIKVRDFLPMIAGIGGVAAIAVIGIKALVEHIEGMPEKIKFAKVEWVSFGEEIQKVVTQMEGARRGALAQSVAQERVTEALGAARRALLDYSVQTGISVDLIEQFVREGRGIREIGGNLEELAKRAGFAGGAHALLAQAMRDLRSEESQGIEAIELHNAKRREQARALDEARHAAISRAVAESEVHRTGLPVVLDAIDQEIAALRRLAAERSRSERELAALMAPRGAARALEGASAEGAFGQLFPEEAGARARDLAAATLEAEIAAQRANIAFTALGSVIGQTFAGALTMAIGPSVRFIHANEQMRRAADATRLSAGQAFQAMVRDIIKSLAAQATVQAVMETALAFASMAIRDADAAAKHWAAAAAFASVGGIAAVAAAAIPSVRRVIPDTGTQAAPAAAGGGGGGAGGGGQTIVLNVRVEPGASPEDVGAAVYGQLRAYARDQGRELRLAG